MAVYMSPASVREDKAREALNDDGRRGAATWQDTRREGRHNRCRVAPRCVLVRSPCRGRARLPQPCARGRMHLDGGHALEKVAVERLQLHVPFWDDAALHQRKRVERQPRLPAGHERARDRRHADEHREHPHSHLHRLHGVGDGGDARLQDAQARVEQDCEDGEGAREVRGQPVRRDRRDAAVDLLDTRLVKPRFDHPPAHEPLRAAQYQEAGQRGGERAWDLAAEGEVGEGDAVDQADRAAHHAMEPFPEEDLLEIVEREAARAVCIHVEPLVLGELLPTVEFSLPFCSVARPALALRPPVRHRQARPRQPRDAPDNHHGEDRRARADEPPANSSRGDLDHCGGRRHSSRTVRSEPRRAQGGAAPHACARALAADPLQRGGFGEIGPHRSAQRRAGE